MEKRTLELVFSCFFLLITLSHSPPVVCWRIVFHVEDRISPSRRYERARSTCASGLVPELLAEGPRCRSFIYHLRNSSEAQTANRAPAATAAARPGQNVSLFGSGGHDGAELLRALAGDPNTLEALFACTMGLNAEVILSMLGVRRDIFAVIACHHPERCWQGNPAKRRHPRHREREAAVPSTSRRSKGTRQCACSSRPSAMHPSGGRRTRSGTSTRRRAG